MNLRGTDRRLFYCFYSCTDDNVINTKNSWKLNNTYTQKFDLAHTHKAHNFKAHNIKAHKF